eukprot:TRINITY_DN57316_c0_g1_i1.p1 TRINITY_DN57316_c0_g1~~TRINITY_DN57316_c0_g1_i1.p1  ORF type:complete len:154 (+),score=19.59 TRINITY_DN57316_c0_g1_i1:82-543(+)
MFDMNFSAEDLAYLAEIGISVEDWHRRNAEPGPTRHCYAKSPLQEIVCQPRQQDSGHWSHPRADVYEFEMHGQDLKFRRYGKPSENWQIHKNFKDYDGDSVSSFNIAYALNSDVSSDSLDSSDSHDKSCKSASHGAEDIYPTACSEAAAATIQ